MFCSTATMERETEATTRSSTTVRRTERWPPPRTWSGRSDATQLPPSNRRGDPPPDQARTEAQRAWAAAATSPMRTPIAAPEGPYPAATRATTATTRMPISTSRFAARGR